ncbi:ftsK/SpoIIIE family protein [Mycobacterium xenopi 4042]|uniref:FtsK/SpoIIIE family protein n=1 Tax=Mycobacterium xenopi 4042 TaxID=1299334 RepID=X7YRA6_MYCXE|nr:ftsK/SpoIIIE family protein [Mycobacterium xenopi 4042]
MGSIRAPVVVNMKEDSEGGMGSHGLILGYTGSGKSSFVADLLLGVVATHTPEQVNLILVDYKGDGTFPGFEKLNHTVQVLSNIGDKDSVNRLEDVLRGEVERRQRLRKEAGRFKDAASYLKARERGAKSRRSQRFWWWSTNSPRCSKTTPNTATSSNTWPAKADPTVSSWC